MADDKYLNFPVALLCDAFTSIRQTMNNVMSYAGYVYTLKLEHGDQGEKLAYLAIKSIIGSKPYIKLTNEFLIARMAGCATIAELPNPLPLPLADYATRRKLDKIKFELQTAWNVNIYSRYVRGFYASIDY
jgi:hypothetical protein